MNLAEMLEALGLAAHAARAARVHALLRADAPEDWRRLAAALALRCVQRRTRVLAIGGGQGAGKSTLAALTVGALEALDVGAVSVSLDDFYLPRSERARLARDVHPLLATRGAPGTHDVPLAIATIGHLLTRGRVRVPRFDKGLDDRDGWRVVEGPHAVVVFEGWCVGAPAEPESRLAVPCNALERDEDPDGACRRYVNARLGDDYAELWALADELLFLAVPGLEAIRRWRGEQEAGLPAERRMDARALARFIDHYERLTRWMLEVLPQRADLVARLGPDHRLQGLETRARG